MKKLSTILIALLLLLSAEGQILRYSNYTAPTPPEEPTGEYCDEYQAVYDAMTNKPSAANANYQNAMVDSLVSQGYWTSRMELFYVFAQESTSSTELSLNWTAPTGSYNLTDDGSVNPYEHAIQYEGIDANGSDDWLNTNWNPNDNATNVSINSFTVGAYLKDDAYGTYAILGCRYGSNTLRAFPLINATSTSVTINTSDAQNSESTSRLGLFMSTRRASEDQESYLNGSPLVNYGSTAGTSMPDYSLAVLCYNYNGTRSAYYDGVASIIFVMNAVSDSDVIAINTIIEAYMDAIGEGVQ